MQDSDEAPALNLNLQRDTVPAPISPIVGWAAQAPIEM